VDAEPVARAAGFQFHPSWWRGWQLKPLAVRHCRFREVLMLDADCYPVRDPEFIFDWGSYRKRGAVFWPDLDVSAPLLREEAFAAWGVAPFLDRPTESGQLLIDKHACGRELDLALFYNGLAEYSYRLLWGDKDTYPIAWRRVGTEYARMWPNAGSTSAAILQYDWEGRVLFQHRAGDKFRLDDASFESTPQRQGSNLYDSSLALEAFCFEVLDELGRWWPWRGSSSRTNGTHVRSSSAALAPASRRVVEASCVAVMISCPERESVCRATLRDLAETDWSSTVHLERDGGTGTDFHRRQLDTARRALTWGWRSGAEFVLFLEDDLTFNRHLDHNLRAWDLFQERAITLASLYNPGVGTRIMCPPRAWLAAEPSTIFGSQAFLISRHALEHILARWDQIPGLQDIKMSRLAAELGRPIYYHAPSLIQHVGRHSTWNGGFHEAVDFDREWQAQRESPLCNPR
jgi:hypothetical protein